VGKKRKNLAAVAFVSEESRKLLPLKPGDVLVVDMSTERRKTGATNPYVIADFIGDGVSVFTTRGLHAKIFALGDCLIVGSTNLSRSSNSNLEEAAMITSDKATVLAGRKFIQELTEQYGTLRVNDEILKKAKAQFREHWWHTGGRKPETTSEAWAVKVMRTIAPLNVAVPKRGAPHIEPDHSSSFRDIYLNESGDSVVLGIYPADTATQAVSFYDKVNRERLVKLSKTKGWAVWPNFHLGYRGFSERSVTKKSLNTYLKFWEDPPETVQLMPSRKPPQYTRLVQDLTRLGMIEATRQKDIRTALKGRPWIALRPGLGLNFTWPSRRPSVTEIKSKIESALWTWEDSLAWPAKDGKAKLRVQS